MQAASVYRGRSFKATVPASGAFAGSRKIHSRADIRYVMSVYGSLGMRWLSWIVNITLALVSYAVPGLARSDLSLSPRANAFWLSMGEARMVLFP